MTREPKPWEILPYETRRAYSAFVAYMQTPPGERSLRDLATALGHRNPSTVFDWSSKWSWQARIKEWDRHNDRSRQRAMAKHFAAAAENQAAIGVTLVTRAQTQLFKRLQDGADGEPVEFVPIETLLRALEIGTRLNNGALQIASNLSPADDPSTEADATFDRLMDRFQEIADSVIDDGETMSMAERLVRGHTEPTADAG